MAARALITAQGLPEVLVEEALIAQVAQEDLELHLKEILVATELVVQLAAAAVLQPWAATQRQVAMADLVGMELLILELLTQAVAAAAATQAAAQ